MTTKGSITSGVYGRVFPGSPTPQYFLHTSDMRDYGYFYVCDVTVEFDIPAPTASTFEQAVMSDIRRIKHEAELKIKDLKESLSVTLEGLTPQQSDESSFGTEAL